LLDGDGRPVCSGFALVWGEQDRADEESWGGEFFQLDNLDGLTEAVEGWVRTSRGELYPVLIETCDERSVGGACTVTLRFRGRRSEALSPSGAGARV